MATVVLYNHYTTQMGKVNGQNNLFNEYLIDKTFNSHKIFMYISNNSFTEVPYQLPHYVKIKRNPSINIYCSGLVGVWVF